MNLRSLRLGSFNNMAVTGQFLPAFWLARSTVKQPKDRHGCTVQLSQIVGAAKRLRVHKPSIAIRLSDSSWTPKNQGCESPTLDPPENPKSRWFCDTSQSHVRAVWTLFFWNCPALSMAAGWGRRNRYKSRPLGSASSNGDSGAQSAEISYQQPLNIWWFTNKNT